MAEQPLVWGVHAPRLARRGHSFTSFAVGTQRRRLLAGCVLLALVGVGGLYFAFVPGPTPLDRLAESMLPNEWSSALLGDAMSRVLPALLVAGAACSCVVSMFGDRRRTITCVAAPLIAWAISEQIAKPLVGRTIRGSLCYPSGHMTGTTAVLAVALLVVPRRFRTLAVVVDAAIAITVAVVLLLLRWHYLTDELAGAAVGIGTVLVVDASLHLLPKGLSLHGVRRVLHRGMTDGS